MEPTLEIGDHILVSKFIYGIKIPFTSYNLLPLQKPKKGDVVVFIYPNDRDKDFIKRVAAVEGETVQIINKKLQINGAPVPDPHAVFKETGPLVPAAQRGENFGPVRVPPGKIFVLGDNRDRSLDSRFWGFVSVEDVRGKAFIVYWSWDSENEFSWYRLDKNIRWSRFGHLIE